MRITLYFKLINNDRELKIKLIFNKKFVNF